MMDCVWRNSTIAALRICSALALAFALLAHILTVWAPYRVVAILDLAAFVLLMPAWFGVMYLWAAYSCRFTGHVRSIHMLPFVWRTIPKRTFLVWILLLAYPVVLLSATNLPKLEANAEIRDGRHVVINYGDHGVERGRREVSEAEYNSIRQSQIQFSSAFWIPVVAIPAWFLYFVHPGLRRQYVKTLPLDSMSGANQNNFAGI